ncbi:MAG: nucleoside monophosphate kinase [Puniceicoccaceae bacterium]|nr:MAG: nucleoside monophosphate kinase [Puniceicoccaceae bacterium]
MTEKPIIAPPADRSAWLEARPACLEPPGATPRHPFRLVLLGPPGVGKGTQAARISAWLGACPLSTGDVFRHAKATETTCCSPAMTKALEKMSRGELVDDAIVLDLIRERTTCLRCGFGFCLDGFPRTVEQARRLDVLLAELNRPLHAAVDFTLPREKLLRRLSGRRTCPKCRRGYHLETSPPRREDHCDDCGEVLQIREDDRPEAVAVRLEAYAATADPLLAYYEASGRLIRIEAEKSPEAVFRRTVRTLRARFKEAPPEPWKQSET